MPTNFVKTKCICVLVFETSMDIILRVVELERCNEAPECRRKKCQSIYASGFL